MHWRFSLLEYVFPDDRLVYDKAFSKPHAGQSAELGVPAFDELREHCRV
jgi:hypothetical protein